MTDPLIPAVLAYGAAATLHASGFLAVYVAGPDAQSGTPNALFLRYDDFWRRQEMVEPVCS